MENLSNVVWRKSSYSGGNGGDCVEVAVLPDERRAVRDSKDPGRPGAGVRHRRLAGVHHDNEGLSSPGRSCGSRGASRGPGSVTRAG